MSSPSSSLQTSQRADLLIILALIATGLGIYAQTLNYAFISLDDPGYIVHNAHVTRGLTWEGWTWAWTSLEESNWHPLTWLSLMLDAQLYGLNAGGYHLTNLLLHVANGVLVFLWLRQATGARWPSALTAFFFIAHPLHVESVAWVTERKDVLSAFFFCLTLLAYTRYVRSGNGRFYWLAVGLFVVGLTAKPMLVTLAPLLLLLDYWPLGRWGSARWQQILWEKVPFCLLAVVSSGVTIIAQRRQALVPVGMLPVSYRIASAMLGYGSYLCKTLLPLNLGVYYPYWQGQSLAWAFEWFVALVLVTTVACATRKRWPWLLVGWGWFLGMLLPVIGVVQVGGQAVADRYAYLPHVGLFIAVFWTGAAVGRRWAVARVALGMATLCAMATCTVLGYQQTGYWRNSATLYEHTVEVVHPTARLYHLLGDAFVEEKQPRRAMMTYLQLRQMGALDPETASALITLLISAGHWSDAIMTARLWADRPDASPELLNNYAYALQRTGHGEQALAVYQKCVTRFPDYAMAHFGLAEVLQERGDVNGSATEDAAGLALKSDWQPALVRLSWNCVQSGDRQTQENGLSLARYAAKLSEGHDLATLNVLAFAQAIHGEWSQAVVTAGKAVDLVARAGTSAQEATKCRARLECYQRNQMPR